jgi:3-methyladenine DNA glycosylase AlkD
MTASAARKALRRHANPKKAVTYRGFFKDSKNDVFLGVTTQLMRGVAKEFRHLDLKHIKELMLSEIHDERSLAHAILRLQFHKGDARGRKTVFDFYIKHRGGIRQWDGVDDSAPYIVGPYLMERSREMLYKFAIAKSMWDRRIAIVSTWHFIRNGDTDDAFKIAAMLLDDDEDLIHKATGWMLREAGKKDMPRLKKFLKANGPRMPRTMLRYAIERFPEKERKAILASTPKPVKKRK